ncbi:MAG: hypothetical protein GY757_48430 [bacterium]|nr:hypothetical protein [bacterium]
MSNILIAKRRFFQISTLFILVGLGLYLLSSLQNGAPIDYTDSLSPAQANIARGWQQLTGGHQGKVIFAQPPDMMVLYLDSGKIKPIPNVIVAGDRGRRKRGQSPRPAWAPDGKRFVYRFDNTITVCDEKGNKSPVFNDQMDCSDETRWSWLNKNSDWLVGPSKKGNVIAVNIQDPTLVKTLYSGGDVEKHCEITGDGYVVYDNDSDIYVTPAYSNSPGIKISFGQSCRPCASPGNRVAWLTVPHSKYFIHDAVTGKRLGELPAPEGEELYRLNWSNHPDFAVHMFGSRGNCRIHIRKISTGESLFIANGWDPDLWLKEEKKVPKV